MIQMDANTENQIQVLRETEMLTTQGLGECERVIKEPDVFGDCSDIDCYPTNAAEAGSSSTWVPEFAERKAVAYNKCDGHYPTRDCFETIVIINGKRELQTCAEWNFYHWACDRAHKYFSYPITRATVSDKPGCGAGDGIGTGGSTSI